MSIQCLLHQCSPASQPKTDAMLCLNLWLYILACSKKAGDHALTCTRSFQRGSDMVLRTGCDGHQTGWLRNSTSNFGLPASHASCRCMLHMSAW